MAATHNKMHEHIKEVVLRKSCDPAGARDLRDVRDVKAESQLSERKKNEKLSLATIKGAIKQISF